MTTPQAEKQYLEDHKKSVAGKGYSIFNPNDVPEEQLPFIYGFNNGGSSGFMHATLIAEDGTSLGGHACSHEGYMEHDLGILDGSRPDRHDKDFKKHYPDGYRMDFVTGEDVKNKAHHGLEAAIEKHQIKHKDELQESAETKNTDNGQS